MINRWKWPCDTCGKEFSSIGAAKKHEQGTPYFEKKFCDMCDYTCLTKPRLKDHKETKHMGLRYKCYQCKFCGKISPRSHPEVLTKRQYS